MCSLLMKFIGWVPIVEEYLYSAMEDFKIDIMIESGP
jgi:Holliday junction resolvasome RuvABC ATP-dependent DNA helicase subunit